MKTLSSIFCLLFLVNYSFAQKRQNVYHLKNDGRYVNLRDSADYTRIVQEPDSGSTLYNVFEYYLSGKKKLIGKSSAINPPKFEGQVLTFYSSEIRKSISFYSKGVLINDRFEYYPNGKLYKVEKYPDQPSAQQNDFTAPPLIMANYDSLGKQTVVDGNGYYKAYSSDFKYVTEEGNVSNGRAEGKWTGYNKYLDITFAENYKDGKLIDGFSVQKGDTVYYKDSRGTPPSFTGGMQAFYRFLSSNIKYPDQAVKNAIDGRVIVGFNVEKDGSLSEVKALNTVSPELDAEAVRVLKKSPKWKPGVQYGRIVKVKFTIPVVFALR